MKDEWKITASKKASKSCVNIYFNGCRFRFSNGKVIGVNLKASENLDLLKSAFELKLIQGWKPVKKKSIRDKPVVLDLLTILQIEVDKVQTGNYSYHHKRDCKWVFSELSKFLSEKGLDKVTIDTIRTQDLNEFVTQPKWSNRTQRNILTTLKCLSNAPLKEHLNRLKIRKSKSILHKPIKDINGLLNDLKEHNSNLHLSCLITYGCLLRPHQEIRLLKWSDIDLNKGFISLSGARNKSGRNRIVPIPEYLKEELLKLSSSTTEYLFSNKGDAYSKDYFSVQWKRYKKRSSLELQGITLYSFRHTGAIRVFEKTGSLQKLQQVMGHSNMQVSLTYLRGLELTQLDAQDLPTL